jgi:two-component system, NarL family, sensor histidine kinase UhpB
MGVSERRIDRMRPIWHFPDRMPLAWRIFVANAAILVCAAAALALSPATVSSPIHTTEVAVLTLGLVAILAIDLILIRRSFSPLARLTLLMRRIDLLTPGQRLDVTGPAEVRELGAVFNEMLERLERERRESGADALKRLESERKRVAQELHDEVGQALTAVMLQLARLSKTAPGGHGEQLAEALETTRDSLEDVRRIARQLRPEALDDLGLVPALNALASGFADRTGIPIVRWLPDAIPAVGPEAELVAFRVAQESLTNAARHAHAHRLDLVLEQVGRSLVLEIRDDGRGINGAPAGSGIRGMRERALLVGAELSIGPAGGGGTTVRLELPLSEPK